MDTLLILRKLKVENANAISGMTWGFPAISNFLGYVHALSRKVQHKHGFVFEGCGVICHAQQVQAYQPRGWGDYVFSLTRNPLTKDAKSPPFIEEGRMHLTVSLVIPCQGDVDGETQTIPPTCVLDESGAGIVGPLVYGKKKNFGGVVERVHGAVAVVYVPIQNQDSIQTVNVNTVHRSHRDVVEKAESHCPSCFGVVAGGTNKGERAAAPAA